MTTLERLPAKIRALPIGVLHLGTKSKLLERSGYLTVGHAADLLPDEALKLEGIGLATIESLSRQLAALSAAILDDGELDWSRYCELSGVILLPQAQVVQSGNQFLRLLSGVTDELAATLANDVDAIILRERVARHPTERRSLDEIGLARGISRERVRQREQTLLSQLASALIWDAYDGSLRVHFHPSFSQWWRMAAARFGDLNDISYEGFVTGLVDVWRVDSRLLVENLPVILAIVTGDARIPTEFRSALQSNVDTRAPSSGSALYGTLSRQTKDVCWNKLRVGKFADEMTGAGVATVGQLIELCRARKLSSIRSRWVEEGLAHLAILEGCLSPEGEISWPAYRASLGLETLPRSVPGTPIEFLSELPSVVQEILARSSVTLRAAEIFRLRTSKDRAIRQTLSETAKALGTHGPSVKREETLFLQYLHNLFVRRDFSSSPYWIDETWLEFWQAARGSYDVCDGEYSSFSQSLEETWGISKTASSRSLPVLWAVLNGYPTGRPPRLRGARVSSRSRADVHPLDRIRLVGFRRPH